MGLARAHLEGPGTDDGIQTGRKLAHPRAGTDGCQRLPDLLIAGIFPGEHDVIAQGAPEDVMFLGHQCHLPAQVLQGEAGQTRPFR